MPTLYQGAAAVNVLNIHGLDANPVYLLLYVAAEIEEILYSLLKSAALLFPNRHMCNLLHYIPNWLRNPQSS